MKRISKFISILLASTLMLSSTVWAATGVDRLTFTREILNANNIGIDDSLASAFTDVEAPDAAYMAAAKQANIVTGYGDGTFRPTEHLTMEQAAIIALNGKGLQEQVAALTDSEAAEILGDKVSSVSRWARKHAAYAVKYDIMPLSAFDADSIVTEEQANAIIEASIALNVEATAPVPKAATISEAHSTSETAPELQPETSSTADTLMISNVMLASDMLMKSNEQLVAAKTYKMSGTMDMAQKISVNGETMDTNSSSTLDSSFETPNKMVMDLVTSVTIPGAAEPTSIPMSMYMDDTSFYLKGGGISENWMAIDSSLFDMDSLTNSSSMLSEEQISALAESISFGENKKVDGKDCYTINVKLDSKAYKELMDKTFDTMSASISTIVESILTESGQTLTDEEKTLVAETLDQAMKSIQVSGQYDYYVDAETLLPVQMDMDVMVKMALDIEDEKMDMNSTSTSTFKIYDFGKAIVFPEVSE